MAADRDLAERRHEESEAEARNARTERVVCAACATIVFLLHLLAPLLPSFCSSSALRLLFFCLLLLLVLPCSIVPFLMLLFLIPPPPRTRIKQSVLGHVMWWCCVVRTALVQHMCSIGTVRMLYCYGVGLVLVLYSLWSRIAQVLCVCTARVLCPCELYLGIVLVLCGYPRTRLVLCWDCIVLEVFWFYVGAVLVPR